METGAFDPSTLEEAKPEKVRNSLNVRDFGKAGPSLAYGLKRIPHGESRRIPKQ